MGRDQQENNLYNKYKPTRKSSKQVFDNLESLLHEDLVGQVTIQKYKKVNVKRGL